MSEINYTPGPWKVNNFHDLRGPNDEFICDLYSTLGSDAKLMAAAPDLLEACEHVINVSLQNHPDDVFCNIDWDILDYAIKRAKGE